MRWSIHTAQLVQGENARAVLAAAWADWKKSAANYLRELPEENKAAAEKQVAATIDSVVLLVKNLPPVMISLQGQIGHAPTSTPEQDPVRGRINISVDTYE